MVGISEIPIKSNKKLGYFDIAKYLLDNINLDNIQISSYNNFIENIIPKHLGKTYPKNTGNDAFQFSFVKWWLDTTDMPTKEMCFANKESQEVTLKALINVQFNRKFYGNDKDTPSNSICFEIDVTKFPYLNDNGNFIINGTRKILISFPATADKIILTDLTNKIRTKEYARLKEKQLQFNERLKLGESRKSVCMFSKGVEISYGSGLDLYSYKKILEDLGYRDIYTITSKITGENPFILNQLNENYSDTKTHNKLNINQVLDMYELQDNYERTNLNLKMSLMNNIVGFSLADNLNTKSLGELPKGHVFTIEDAEKLTLEGITELIIDVNNLKVPVRTNGFVPFDDLLKSLELPLDIIPASMIEYSSQYLKSPEDIYGNETKVKELNKNYLWVNRELFMKIYNDVMERDNLNSDEEKIEVLKTALVAYESELAGRFLTKEDLLGMINLYCRYTLNVIESDDIDSLENKRILNIAEIFEEGLISAIESIKLGIETVRRNYNNRQNNSLEKTDIKNNIRIETITQKSSKNALYRLLDTTNPLSQMNNKRKITSQHMDNYGGIKKESPDTRPRSVNQSFAGRLDIIETPESQSVGLVRHIAAYAYLNINGELEAPFLKIDKKNKCIDLSKIYYMTYDQERKYNRILSPKICKDNGIQIDYYKNQNIVHTEFIKLVTTGPISLEPYHQTAITEMSKYGAEEYKITVQRKDWFEKEDNLVYLTKHGQSKQGTWEDIDLVSITGSHVFSPVSSAIPFIEFDDAARAMMGSIMSIQAIAIWGRQKQLVRTPMASKIAKSSSGVIVAPYDCEIVSVDSKGILIRDMTDLDEDKEEYISCLMNERTAKTTLNKSIPTVKVGDICLKGDIIADNTVTIDGELTHGYNALIGYMPNDGHNYEDAILICEKLVRDDVFTSFHIEEFVMRMGEEDTYISSIEDFDEDSQEYSVDTSAVKYLKTHSKLFTSNGLIKVGAAVSHNDILMAKLTPRTVIDKSKSSGSARATVTKKKLVVVKYTHRTPGIVVDVAEVKKDGTIVVKVATRLKISVGDKLTGRHGNKGVIAKIVPEADMPYLANGRHLDICLTTLGIPSRMNLGQVIEGLAGFKFQRLGIRGQVEQMAGFNIDRFRTEILNDDGSDKVQLYNPKTSKPYRYKTMVVVSYFEKLEHISSHKIHARGFGTPDCTYSTNRQPLQGKASNGGQRLGEMEMWGFQDHGCSNILKELVQYRSDDDQSRNIYKQYEERRCDNVDEELEEFNVPGNVPYAFRCISALFKGMYKEVEFLDQYGNKIDPYAPTVKVKNTGDRKGLVYEEINRDFDKQLNSRLVGSKKVQKLANENAKREQDNIELAKDFFTQAEDEFDFDFGDDDIFAEDSVSDIGDIFSDVLPTVETLTTNELKAEDIQNLDDLENLFSSISMSPISNDEFRAMVTSDDSLEEEVYEEIHDNDDESNDESTSSKPEDNEYVELEDELFDN